MSLWTENIEMPRFEKLAGDTKTDVLIIGGGITGILTARLLTDAGVDCMLVERDRLCSGVTKSTTAKITVAHGLIYSRLLKEFDPFTARFYMQANRDAVQKYTELCKNIDCDFEIKDSYIYEREDPRILENELKALDTIGFPAEYACGLPLPFKTVGAVRIREQAQFHPLKFVSGIVKGLKIYEDTEITELRELKAVHERGVIDAKNIIVATHFPFINKHGLYFLKLYQSRSHAIVLKNAADVDGMYMDANEKGFSFRNSGSLLILGGMSHRTGKCTGGMDALLRYAKKFYPESKVIGTQSAQDCMSLDGMAYIGRYSRSTKGLYVATGFNKWGMTSAMVAAKVLTDRILKNDCEYAGIFSPSRTLLRPQLFVNAAESVSGLVSFGKKRCTHMGCALKWNSAEHSWDCSCHGSRFDKDGRVINNPATENLK